MRIVAWNVRKASIHSGAWDLLLELDPDIALIQDARAIPDSIRSTYAIAKDQTAFHPGSEHQHLSAILAKGEIGPFQPLPTPTHWLRSALAEWREFFTTRRITLKSGLTLNAMSVYGLADPVPKHHWKEQDTEGIQLPMNRELWATEILWSTLRMMPSLSTEPWIVGGDLNTSVLFDTPKPHGNQLILDRMAEIGLPSIELGNGGESVPTFRSNRGHFVHQLDYLFANSLMRDSLVSCEVYGDPERVFGSRPMLSDHLPIIAEFDIT